MSTPTSTNKGSQGQDEEKMTTAQLYAQIALVLILIGGIVAFALLVV